MDPGNGGNGFTQIRVITDREWLRVARKIADGGGQKRSFGSALRFPPGGLRCPLGRLRLPLRALGWPLGGLRLPLKGLRRSLGRLRLPFRGLRWPFPVPGSMFPEVRRPFVGLRRYFPALRLPFRGPRWSVQGFRRSIQEAFGIFRGSGNRGECLDLEVPAGHEGRELTIRPVPEDANGG